MADQRQGPGAGDRDAKGDKKGSGGNKGNKGNKGSGGNKGNKNNVSPMQSMAMTGNTSLAGLSQKNANKALTSGLQNKQGTKYSGDLKDFMQKRNLEIAKNTDRVEKNIVNKKNQPKTKGSFGDSVSKFASGIMGNFTPQRMLGTALGSALLGPLGGILGGLIGGTYGDDNPNNNFFGSMGRSLKTDAQNIMGKQTPNIENPANTTTKIGDTFTMPSYDPSFTEKVSRLFSPDLNYGSFQVDTPVGVGQQTYGAPTMMNLNFGKFGGDPQETMQELGNMATTDFNTRMENAPQDPGFFGRIGRRFTNAGFGIGEGNTMGGYDPNEGNRGGSNVLIPQTPFVTQQGTPQGISNNPIAGYGSIDPNANYGYLFGGRRLANGGLIPPATGPMSNGIGTLYKKS